MLRSIFILTICIGALLVALMCGYAGLYCAVIYDASRDGNMLIACAGFMLAMCFSFYCLKLVLDAELERSLERDLIALRKHMRNAR